MTLSKFSQWEWHSLKSGPEAWNPGLWDARPMTWDPTTLELGPWDMGP